MLELGLQRLDVFLLIFARMMGFFTTCPVFSNRQVMIQVRVAISLVITLLILPLYREVPVPGGLPGLVPLVVQELLVGMMIGFVAALMFAPIQFAGELLDVDLGLSLVNVMDPLTQQQAPIIGNFIYLLALLLLLAIDGHHGLLLAATDSFALIPLSQSVLDVALQKHVVELAGEVFRIGFAMASPLLAALFLVTVAMAVVSRAVPQIHVFTIGMPAKAFAGLVVMATLLPLYALAFRALFERMYAHIYVAINFMK